jgi:hypothetical protein
VKYYEMITCGHCDAEIYRGPCLTLLEHNGLPVVAADAVEQERYDCDKCGAVMYFGELDYVLDTENVHEDDDSEDDDSDGEPAAAFGDGS